MLVAWLAHKHAHSVAMTVSRRIFSWYEFNRECSENFISTKFAVRPRSYSGPLGPFHFKFHSSKFLQCKSHISPVWISHFSSANLTFLQCKSRISSMQISHFLQCKSHISPVQISHFLPCKSHISPFLAGCSQPSILLVTVWIPKLDRTSGLN